MRIYKRQGSPYYQYSFTVHGNRHRGSTGEKTKQKAEITASAIYAEISARRGYNEDWTIENVISIWWQEHASDTKSADKIWSNIENISRCLDCSIMLHELTASDMINFRAKRRGEGVQRPTINRDVAYLRSAINHAIGLHGKKAPDINWKALKYPENPDRIRYASAEEYTRLLDCAHRSLRPIIVAAVCTGLRRSNLFALTWNDIDLSGGLIRINKTKANNSKMIPITAQLKRELIMIRKPSGLVFDQTNFRKRWSAARLKAGIDNLNFHDLRHTFATWARKGGVDIEVLQKALDHGDIRSTLRYAHIEDDEVKTAFSKASDKLDEQIKNADNIVTITGTLD